MSGLERTREALAFQRSVIQCGETYTETCVAVEADALAEVERAEAVIQAARDVSLIERTGVLPDFQPLAAALRALDEDTAS